MISPSSIRSVYRERLPSGAACWSMLGPNEVSEQIVADERRQTYLLPSDDPLQAHAAAPIHKPAGTGTDAGFDQLYRIHSRRIVRWATRFLGNPELGEDAAQEAWITIRTCCDTPERQTPGFINSVVFTTLLNFRRNWKMRSQTELDTLTDDEAEDGAVPTETRASFLATERYQPSLSELHGAELHWQLQMLPDLERSVIQDCYLDGVSNQEFGERHGKSDSWTQLVKSRALNMLAMAMTGKPAAAQTPHRIYAPGTRFVGLTVIRHEVLRDGKNLYLASCNTCGSQKVYRSTQLAKNKSCGCLQGGGKGARKI